MSSFDDALAKASDGGLLAKVLGLTYELTRFKQYTSEVKAVKVTSKDAPYFTREATTSLIMVF